MYTDTGSAQPYGCDEGAGWTCEQHRRDMSSYRVDIDGKVKLNTPQEAPAERIVLHKGVPVGIGGAPTRASSLPTDAAERKKYPMATGCLFYFPDALAAVANVSWHGNEQHNPGKPLHWDRSKSADEADTAVRHLAESGKRDADGQRHTAKAAWRILALLQKEIEGEQV